jgi:two-component system response regulator HydG
VIAPRHLPVLFSREKRPVIHEEKGVPVEKRREDLIRVLEDARGNKGEAARLLGVSRVTLWKLLKKHGITVKPSVVADA